MSRLRVLQLLSLLLFLESGFCWKKYADPIRLADANKYGIYEFNLELKHKLTMSHEKKFHHLDVLDYRPREKSFYKRSSNQLHPCDESSIFVRDALNSHANTNDLDDVLIMHGQHQRVVTINGVSPGKTLVVPHNAEVIMRVKNRLLLEGVTLHLHGVDKKFAWFTDGVAFVQQCPISVNSNFAYRFLADTPGTHWYHGHLMSDRGDGLLGGFIIIKDNETYPNPFITNGPRFHFGKIRQYYALLQDWPVPTSAESWYNHVGETMKWLYGFDNNNGTCWTPTRIADGSNLGGAVPINAILVNDKGWHSQDDIRSIPSSLPLETFRIKKEEEIIIRIVNGGVAQELMVTTEEHEMYIIAADGVEIKPQKVDSLIVFSGERYDVMIKGMKNPNRKVYPILIETIDTVRWDWGVNKPTVTLAKLEYEDVTHDETDQGADYNHSNCKADKQCVVANCPFEDFPKGSVFSCCGVHAVDLESAEEVDKEVTAQKIFTDNEYEEHFINMHFDSHVDGFMFKLPRGVPYFYDNGTNMAEVADTCDYSKCTGTTSRYDPSCSCFWHLTLPLGKIIQLTVYNMGKGGGNGTGYAHPLHIHGTHFYLMKVGYPSYDNKGHVANMNRDIPCANENTSCNKLVWSNKAWLMGNIKGMSTTPSSRDTVVVPVGGYVTLRFKTTNPGWWFAHCHLMLHNMGGTAFAFRVGDPNQVPSPPAAFPHTCGDYEPSSAPKPYMPTPPTTENTKSSPESIGSLNFIFTAAFFAILNALYL